MLLGGRIFRAQPSVDAAEIGAGAGPRAMAHGLEASGQVHSQTETKRGPARFHNAGRVPLPGAQTLAGRSARIRSEMPKRLPPPTPT